MIELGDDIDANRYFGRSREYWWHRDFLDLMPVRCQLARVDSLVDIDCGLPDWFRQLLTYLRPHAALTGLDINAGFVKASQHFFSSRKGQHDRTRFNCGRAEKLPFVDNLFDAATCQTLLIHLDDPVSALREMIRVVKPGG